MNTCKTCRWWGYKKDGVILEYDAVAKACGNQEIVDIEETGYGSVTGSGFGLDYPVCDLITGPDFGCVHWEAN